MGHSFVLIIFSSSVGLTFGAIYHCQACNSENNNRHYQRNKGGAERFVNAVKMEGGFFARKKPFSGFSSQPAPAQRGAAMTS